MSEQQTAAAAVLTHELADKARKSREQRDAPEQTSERAEENGNGHEQPERPGLAEATINWEAVLFPAFQVTIAYAASHGWPEAASTEHEVKALAQAWAPVAEMYLGGDVGIVGAAAITTVAWAGPRIIEASRRHAQAKRYEEESDPLEASARFDDHA